VATLAAAALAGLGAAAAVAAEPGGPAAGRRLVEVRRFAAAEARQGVAVDARHVYAIDDRALGKYDKRSGVRVAAWTAPEGGGFVHLNGGVVREGRILCAHSNYPGVPMLSSIESFDVETLAHVGSHAFGIFQGSATWLDWRDGSWLVAFANYAGRGGVPGRGPAWTSLVRFDASWRAQGGFGFPPEVVARFGTRSASGGAFGPGGLLYATGHDAREVYALRLPAAGGVLELVEVLPAPAAGQGIAWDPDEPGLLWMVEKGTRELVAARLEAPRR